MFVKSIKLKFSTPFVPGTNKSGNIFLVSYSHDQQICRMFENLIKNITVVICWYTC